MIDVEFRIEVPYTQAIVLSQYFDLEHLEHVHPRSFGRARMVSKGHQFIVWDLEWPPQLGFFRPSSRIRQEYHPPWGIRSVITKGFLRGSRMTVQFDATAEGTLVKEDYQIALPAWWGLRDWVHSLVVRRLNRIWEEDLAVKVCRGGWPGVPR